MVPLAVSSMFFHEYTTPEIFSYVERSGLDGIEYWIETPHFWLRDLPAQEIVEAKKSHPGIRHLTVHAPILDLNPCSINPDVAEVSIRHTVQSIVLAEQVGAGVLTVHPGRRTAKRPVGPADFHRFEKYLAAIREAAVRNSLRICMENMEPAINCLICTPERMRELLDQEPWLWFTLDVAHAWAKSPDEPLRYIEICGDRLGNVHISRAEGNMRHLPLDRSPVIEQIIMALQDAGYTGPLTLEIDDLVFQKPLTVQEKISILVRDCSFMKEILC